MLSRDVYLSHRELYLSTATANNVQTVTNVPGPGTVTLNAILQPAMSQVTYGAYTGTAAPTAAVQFFEGTTPVGTAALAGNGTVAALTLTGVKTGAHTYTAYYPGDANYAAYSFGSVSVTVIPTAAPSTTTLTVTPSTLQAGSTTTLAATVTGTSLAANPTGTVTFQDGGTAIGTGGLDANGRTSLLVTLNGPGAHLLTASYGGDANDAASTSAPVSTLLTPIATTTAVGVSSNSVAAGATATVSIFVSSQAGTPAGTVTLYNGTASLGTATLTNGSATLTTTSSGIATQSLSATYAAAGNYGGSASAAIPLAFVAPIALSVGQYLVPLATGQSATVAVTATPATGFTGAVGFSCSSQVSYVTCAMMPASQTVSGAAAVQSTVSLSVGATTASLDPHAQPAFAYGMPSAFAFLPLGAFALLGLVRGRRVPWGVLLLLMAAGAGALSGCSSSAATPPSGSQTVTITATEDALTQTALIQVNITN